MVEREVAIMNAVADAVADAEGVAEEEDEWWSMARCLSLCPDLSPLPLAFDL